MINRTFNEHRTFYQLVSLEEAIRQLTERKLNNIFRATGTPQEVAKALQDEIDEQARASLVIAEEEERCFTQHSNC